jgi:hypothetical protein
MLENFEPRGLESLLCAALKVPPGRNWLPCFSLWPKALSESDLGSPALSSPPSVKALALESGKVSAPPW